MIVQDRVYVTPAHLLFSWNMLFSLMILLGLVELLWQKQDFKALLSAVQLCKSFKAKLWDDSKFVSKQLDGIGNYLFFTHECQVTHFQYEGV